MTLEEARKNAVDVLVVTNDGTEVVLLPIDFIPEIITKLNEYGTCPLYMSDKDMILAKGLVIGSKDFYKERRLIVMGADGNE